MHYLNIKLNGINTNGIKKEYKLSDFKGENLVVYFYPQDDTPVCTQEAKDFKDALKELNKYATVIGVSSNNVEEHKEFKEKYDLNFILLSDQKNELKRAFEEHNEYTQNLHRATFILDKDGKIIKYWTKVDIDGHIKEILDFLKENK